MSKSFDQSAIDLIKMRSSWRSYLSRPLDREFRESIEAFLASKTSGHFGHKMRFRLIEKEQAVQINNAKLGTYGFIKNARRFIVGAVKLGARHWEDYGYVLEEIILKMTDLGLATCWMGGTFKRSEFGKTIDVAEDEVIPAVTPVGHPTASRSFRDRAIRLGAKSRSRKTWEELFFIQNFESSIKREEAGDYAVVLDMVCLAPSASNKQPWRIVRQSSRFHFYLQRTPNYGFHKSVDLQRVDMGIAMCHFALAAEELELGGGWEENPPDIRLPKHAEYTLTWSAY